MPSDTQKHRDFVKEPMGNKPVTRLSGIGPVAGERLKRGGIRQVYGKYLMENRKEGTFIRWLAGDSFRVNKTRAKECYDCLKIWDNGHGVQ